MKMYNEKADKETFKNLLKYNCWTLENGNNYKINDLIMLNEFNSENQLLVKVINKIDDCCIIRREQI